jgi:hypothetical protein
MAAAATPAAIAAGRIQARSCAGVDGVADTIGGPAGGGVPATGGGSPTAGGVVGGGLARGQPRGDGQAPAAHTPPAAR